MLHQAARPRAVQAAVGAAVAAVLAAGPLAGCTAARAAGGKPSILATAAYVAVPTGTTSTVGYLDIRNTGSASDELLSVTTSAGGHVALRAPVDPGDTNVTMHTVPDIEIPGGTMVQLVPNSYHLEISGTQPLHDGKDIMLYLKFAKSGTITVIALVTNPDNGGGSYFLN